MRRKLSAGVLMALVFLIPAAPAMAQTGSPVPNEACQTAEHKVYKDIPKLVTIDLDTATDVQVRIQADQILFEANAESLVVLPRALQDRLDGTPGDLRTFLKSSLQQPWKTDLRIAAVRTLTGAGANVKAAAQKALDDGSVDALLAYLNDGLYAARALDCASQPTTAPPTPTATPSATKTAVAIATSSASTGTSAGGGGGLPVTGSATGTVAGAGGVLLLLGSVGYLLGRRRRARFVA